jgi:uncharacterized membrane protein HdeD (DUF308 family)
VAAYRTVDGPLQSALLSPHFPIAILPALIVMEEYLDPRPGALANHLVHHYGLRRDGLLLRSVLVQGRAHELASALLPVAGLRRLRRCPGDLLLDRVQLGRHRRGRERLAGARRTARPSAGIAPRSSPVRGEFLRSPPADRGAGPRTARGGTMSTSMMFEEREVTEAAADRWWIFLLTGIAWLVFALLVFQWDYTTVYAISFLFGVVALTAGLNEFFAITVSTTGWKIVRAILGVLFVIAGVWALVHPHNAFATLAALMGFFLLFKGIFDLTVAFVAKEQFELWWLQLTVGVIEILLAFWVAGSFRNKAILLVIYVGIVALTRGITELFLAFKLKGLKKQIAPA